MFELVIGELDMIIGKTKTAKSIEIDIMDWMVESESEEELQNKLDALGQTWIQAHQQLVLENTPLREAVKNG